LIYCTLEERLIAAAQRLFTREILIKNQSKINIRRYLPMAIRTLHAKRAPSLEGAARRRAEGGTTAGAALRLYQSPGCGLDRRLGASGGAEFAARAQMPVAPTAATSGWGLQPTRVAVAAIIPPPANASDASSVNIATGDHANASGNNSANTAIGSARMPAARQQ
jgi:hypothetical protein